MKISAANLLIAIAGFLQESKSMHHGEIRAASPAGTIEITTNGGPTLTGVFTHVGHEPSWLENEPTEDFQHYDVHFHRTWSQLYDARINHQTEGHGHNPDSVEVTIDEEKFFSILEGFKPYNYKKSEITFAVDRVYITVPRTRKIYYALLETEFSRYSRWPWSGK